MKTILQIGIVTLLLVGILVQGVSSLTAVPGDFTIDCGTDVGGPETITYQNSDTSGANPVLKISSYDNPASCSATESATSPGEFVIATARTACTIDQPDLTVPIYTVEIWVREFNDVYRVGDDPSFTITCSYVVADQPVATVEIADAGQLGTPTSVVQEVTGSPDQTYSMVFVDPANTATAITAVTFGQEVLLKVEMGGTDADEQGVQVKSCTLQSGGQSLLIIDNYCTVGSLDGLFTNTGFTSTVATITTFPVKIFALEGATSNTIKYECTVSVCNSPCIGDSCVPPPGRKRRQANGSQTEEKTVRMAAEIQILPIGVSRSGSQDQSESSATSCMQSFGFIVVVTVLAVLLLVAMATVIFMFTARRREMQKQGA